MARSVDDTDLVNPLDPLTESNPFFETLETPQITIGGPFN